MPESSARSRVRGCLLGGAVGDALGAPVEFVRHAQIVERYGPGGPSEIGEAYGVHGAITDDTQMTLWTAEGCLRAYHRGATKGVVTIPGVTLNAYIRWLDTQEETPPGPDAHTTSWLFRIPELHARRAPGTTCLRALEVRRAKQPFQNQSKGCGGVMRVAPVGLLADNPKQAFTLGAEIAQLTHGHVTGYVAAGAFALAIHALREGATLDEAIGRSIVASAHVTGGGETVAALDRARQLAASDTDEVEAVHALGTVTPGQGPGWVAEEALAVAALCALRHPADVERALRMAVTHDGDSDSTASICGNLLGTALGVEALPERWRTEVELVDVILQVADDLHDARAVEVDGYGRTGPGWYDRYPPG
ncbi:ADP-ribosylglycohydrolase family protein [Rubrivirga marina]|uniref:ADP-ribosylglycohydrolase n=1 Tax=Rubrivirga marina TaxID=1196024 RepID=A0A271IWB1_9BACT|nr:ADP-ribosylglycohydrolase family protein [Rubrivirga marina]PAP75410.1 hypothetical protein BSZ37_02605 [Rubrivirga marina]